MLLAIAIMIALTVAAAVYWLAPRLAEGQVIFDHQPDAPSGFGYKMSWLAIRTRETERVLDALGLDRRAVANWNSGIGTVYDDQLGQSHIFVTPPVNGWTFVVGLPLPHPLGGPFIDKCTPLLMELGHHFIEIQYYFTYPLVDFYAWARVIDGKLVRAFAINDEGIVWNKGKPTKEERSLGLKLFELRGVRGRKGDAGGEIILYPTEEHVMRLAHKWSLDPTVLDAQSAPAARGWIALAPHEWRAERLRKSA